MSKNEYVTWKAFKIIITIAISIFGILLSIQISLMTSLSEIKSDVSAIKTDIGWIKEVLRRDIAYQNELENYQLNK